jgi:hypothetical protein
VKLSLRDSTFEDAETLLAERRLDHCRQCRKDPRIYREMTTLPLYLLLEDHYWRNLILESPFFGLELSRTHTP